MSTIHSKYIIIGAGLSGLTTAYELMKNGEANFRILESRALKGGRINTINSIDLGATWLQNHHHYLRQLLDELNLQTFEQYSNEKSILVYNSMAPAHYFESNTNDPSAYRIAGGSMALINALSKEFNTKIALNTIVTTVSEINERIHIQTNHKTYSCDQLVITIPPKLASSIVFEPKLPNACINILKETHTWMSNAIKVGLTFKVPFWREQGLSGMIISQISPVTELYDHCNSQEASFGLMGFVNERLRELTPENRKEQILSYLEKYLGPEINSYIDYHEKDWSLDEHTSNKQLKSVYMSPQYGNPLYQNFFLREKVLFSGTETSQVYGGYMEGAVISGMNAAQKLLKK